MVAQVVAILALMLASDLTGEPGRWLRLLGQAAVWVVVGLALWSAVEYYQTFAAVVSGRTVPPNEPPADTDPGVGPLALAATTSAALAVSKSMSTAVSAAVPGVASGVPSPPRS
jgi:hypothetical protein